MDDLCGATLEHTKPLNCHQGPCATGHRRFVNREENAIAMAEQEIEGGHAGVI